jgi:integrase
MNDIDKATINFRDRSLKEFKSLLSSLKKYPRTIEEGSTKAKELRLLIESLPQVKRYIQKFVGPLTEDSFKTKRNKTVKIITDHLLGDLTLKEALDGEGKITLKSRRDIQLYKKQKLFLKTIPKKLRAYLPDTITVDVDDKGRVKNIGELFANKTYTVAEKALNQRKILEQYDDIEKTLKSSLDSKYGFDKISALVLLIILETGIRPGRHGNAILAEGEEIETFGALTLKREHLRLQGDGTILLRFEGKKGVVNRASLTDTTTTKVLREYIEGFEGHSSDYLFGEDFKYRHLKKYFKENFGELRITDFRKLRATEAVYETLKQERDTLMLKIKSYVDLEVEEAAEKTIDEICKVLDKAHKSAQVALSHDSPKTTKQSYINPEVILHFLSKSDLKGSLRDCILKGETKLEFDPLFFLRESQKVSSARGVKVSSGLGRVLYILELI